MDLSHLTRPSILCQCSRCSSTVAACENEWAKLSDTYSTVTGWLSIDMNRINVSADKKQIPQSSELEFVRGRVVQDIQCRLCHKKLGGLVHLETETKVFWKLPKVSFREIISMRESHPLFVEGSLSWLLAPIEEAVSPTATAGNTTFSANHSESTLNNTLLKQGASLSKISNSVEELHDTMSDLKQSFKALRLELNTTPSTRSQDYHGDEAMEMLRTVLKDLQSKSDEIEKLKLENESLKLKNKCLIQGRQISSSLPITPNLLGGDRVGIPEVQTPGFLTERGKRDLLVAATQAPIADSFDEEIMDDTASNEAAPLSIAPVKVPLKPAAEEAPTSPQQTHHEPAGLGSPFGSRSRRDSREPATKRLRLTMTEDQEIHSINTGVTTSPPAKNKKRGRRPSQQKSQPEEPHTLSTGGALSNTNAADEIRTEETQPTRPQKRRGRGRSKTSAASRSTSQAAAVSSRGSSRVTRKATKSQEEAPAAKLHEQLSLQNELLPGVLRSAGFEVAVKNVAELTPESVLNESDLFPPRKDDDDHHQREVDAAENEKRRQAKIAARDLVAKAAMEREEAMDDG